MTELTGPHHLPTSSDVRSLVIFLHGFGADGNDLIGLARLFARHLPNTAFYAPNGPEVCEISSFGRQWFSLAQCDGDYGRRKAETQKSAFEAMYASATRVAPLIENYVDNLCRRHRISREKTALMGFSQGTMMALHLGMRQQPAYGAIVGFSGALVGASHLQKEIISRPPTLLVHGENDDMLPVHAVELAEAALQQNNVSLEVLRRPGLGHSIDAQGVTRAAQFLKKQFT